MFADAFTSVLLMPTFASTPTFGFTFTPVPELPPAAADSVEDDWLVEALWSIVEEELMSVELWFALTLLDTDWSPLPTFTPGLMFAPALMSVLLMPTLASTPTLGLALTVRSRLSSANAGLNAASTAAALAVRNSLFRVMRSPFKGGARYLAGFVPARCGESPHRRMACDVSSRLCERVGLLQNQQPIRASVAVFVHFILCRSAGRGVVHGDAARRVGERIRCRASGGDQECCQQQRIHLFHSRLLSERHAAIAAGFVPS